jgi:UDP-N-acetylglucosamine:LPS N-acetylglucosamine transferase
MAHKLTRASLVACSARETMTLQHAVIGSFEMPSPAGSSRMKLMITLGGGGFLLEAQSLLRRLGTDYEYCYITGEDCIVPKELVGAEIYKMRPFALLGEPHLWQRVPAFLKALVQAYRSLSRSKPDCVICVGSAMAVPMCLAARTLGVRTVFVESITRFERPSVTARLVSHLRLADRVYVQWPDSTHLYRNGIYRGTVL